MRRTFTAEEKASVFELWKNGTGFSEIANILGSKPGTIFTMLRDTGGIKPHERKRAVAHLTLSEREEIRAGLSAKMSIRAIATALNRSPLNRPGFPGECFICELRLPDHRFRWKHN
ncbi:helix-turn-helix domain-containing protein, partial [Escherichia coli]